VVLRSGLEQIVGHALPRYRAVLKEKRRIPGDATRAIEAAEQASATGQQPDMTILKKSSR